METIKIKKQNAAVAYKNADAKGKKILEDLLGKENILPVKITDRIKTFDDVLIDLHGQLPDGVLSFLEGTWENPDMISTQAHLKLTLIAKSLNEGWTPDWADSSQYKYTPWFKHKAGFGLAYYVCADWATTAHVGSRLCFKTAELAEYAATQFADIYNDFLTIK